MPFPTGWPGRKAPSVRSHRFFVSGTSTANFADNAWFFSQDTGASQVEPLPIVSPPAKEGIAGSPTTIPVNPQGGGVSGDVPPLIWCCAMRITHTGGTGTLEFSFDGTNIHGIVAANESIIYRDRYECGISIRGAGGTPTFRIEAW